MNKDDDILSVTRKELNQLLTQICTGNCTPNGVQVAPHSQTMNISHCNYGEISTGRPVDKWHIDSVDLVLVIILSDTSDMVGGELKVLQVPDASGNYFNTLIESGIPDEALIETVKYTSAGYGIFMQGSKILHTVSEVLAAREPRISLVNSCMYSNPFIPYRTRYSTFIESGFNDRRDILDLEYARHKAWRISGQMKYILDHMSTNDADVKTKLCKIMGNSIEELQLACDLLQGSASDDAKWVEANEPNEHEHEQTSKSAGMMGHAEELSLLPIPPMASMNSKSDGRPDDTSSSAFKSE